MHEWPEPFDIGDRLLIGRRRKGLTQPQMAERLREAGLIVGPSTISRWEDGITSPTVAQLLIVCSVLDLEPTSVLAKVA